MIYAAPGAVGAPVAFKSRYDNFIGGQFVAPLDGQYFDVITPAQISAWSAAASAWR